MIEENKMYEYLLEHNYISKNENKNPLRQQELSKERAECIANKYNNLVEELQNNWNELKKGIEDVLKTTYEKWGRNCANEFDLGCLEIEMTINNYGEILSKMQELEGNNE